MARIEVISSDKNPVLKQVRRALAKGVLTEDGYAVAETFHLLEEALRSDVTVGVVLAAESVRAGVEAHIKGLKKPRLLVVADKIFEAIADTAAPQGVMTLIKPPEWTLEHVFRGRSLVVVLDGLQDPGNAGAIVRAAEAFGATGALFLRGTVSPWNAKTLRASAGSLFRLPVVAGLDAELVRATLEQRRLDIYAAVPRGGQALNDVDLTRRAALIIGSEGHGVGRALRAAALDLHIPTAAVESLNASLAAGILLYEAARQRRVAVP
jgi:TrmH family RNA methyltransferase